MTRPLPRVARGWWYLKKLIGVTSIGVLVLGLLAHSGALASLFSSNYLPHRYCYLARPGLVWTNAAMDSLIAASYFLIFCCLIWIAGKLRGRAALQSYVWILVAFGSFIAACGATHLMEVVTVWWPVYPLSAAVKVVCAAASVVTAAIFAYAAPMLSANARRIIEELSTARHDKEQAERALVASEKLAAVGRISASIAHEIKNPLEAVGNLLYLLAQDERMPADLAGLVENATSEVKRANDIAHNTLSFYRESDTAVRLSLSTLVEGVVELHKVLLLQQDITLQTRISTPCEMMGYSGDLRSVVLNLIQNAAAAIRSGGSIYVRVQPRHLPTDESVRKPLKMEATGYKRRAGQPGYSITIADTGPGIDPKYRERLFSMFFTTKGEQGSGIGLWLVRSMVEKHGGRIRFRSRTITESKKPGTIFNIWLPLETAALVDNQQADSSAA